MFDELVQPQSRNSLAVDAQLTYEEEEDDDDGGEEEEEEEDSNNALVGGTNVKLSQEIRYALAQRLHDHSFPTTAVSRTRCTRDGVNFTVKKVHEGNSCVFRKESKTPYCIEQILTIPEDPQGVWLVVRGHRQAHVRVDPYRRYPLLRARLWSLELEPKIEVVEIREVDAHFAKCPIQWEQQEVAVVVSLSRVRLHYASLTPQVDRKWIMQDMRLLSS